jgi:hypothetical protein
VVPELKVNPKAVLQVDSIKLKPNHDFKKKSFFKHGTQFQARGILPQHKFVSPLSQIYLSGTGIKSESKSSPAGRLNQTQTQPRFKKKIFGLKGEAYF